MSTAYIWRKLSSAQREELLQWRKVRKRPWHWPPHQFEIGGGVQAFHLTAACYEHTAIIGASIERMEGFAGTLLEVLGAAATPRAWCVLPNHYHVLVETENLAKVLFELGRMHGRFAVVWNREDHQVGRHVFHGVVERRMRTDRHYFATMNYVHNNPVRHGYVKRWEDWPWGSAVEYLRGVGREVALRVWRDYPVRGYGKDWDEPWM